MSAKDPNESILDNSVLLRPIGLVHSSQADPMGAPLHPRMASGFRGELELFSEFVDGLADLEGFSRIWLVFLLHRSLPPGSLQIIPYRDIVPRGIFSTRAPSRPNPIGISPVRLIERKGDRLILDEVDLLDGTPILDIKPYVPEYDSYPSERTGWIGESPIAASVTRADGRFHKG
jgi:tRNA (adenine37-N6)-methyltransferase